MPGLKRGSIVWAELRDPHGRNPKRRPVVVLASADAVARGVIDGVAVSTAVPDPPPEDCIPLPWDPSGRAVTGFHARCFAVCSWGASLAPSDVEDSGKHVPPNVVTEILQRIATLRAKTGGQP